MSIYLSLAHNTTPFVTTYKRAGDVLTKLADPAVLPASNASRVGWSPDGVYLAVAHNTTPFVTIYKRAGDVLTKLANPAVLPGGNGRGVAWSPDGVYLAVGNASATPFIIIYKRDGDVFTKLADPAVLPGGAIGDLAWSNDGVYLASTFGASPFIMVYKRDGDVFTKIADPAVLPASTGNAVGWSSDGIYLAVAHFTTPFITIYKRAGDVLTKLANPAVLPATTAYGASWSPDGVHLAVPHDLTPFITVYKRAGDVLTKLANPAVLPLSGGKGAHWSNEGTYLSIGVTDAPFIMVYKRAGDVFTKIADPAVLPGGSGQGVSFRIEWIASAIGSSQGLATPVHILSLADVYSATDTQLTNTVLSLATNDTAAITDSSSRGMTTTQTEAAAAITAIESGIYTQLLEAVNLTDLLGSQAATTGNLAVRADAADKLQQAINQVVAETLTGSESISIATALTLVDALTALDTSVTLTTAVLLVAETIAALDAIHRGETNNVVESGALVETHTLRIARLVALLEQAQATDTNTALVRVFHTSSDSAATVESFNTQSLLSALLLDGVIATITLKVGGDLFTGWVLNTGTLAASEYQFADREFNSACKHGNRYLMAADDGIYQFTEDANAETVMTYIKTGKLDLGSDKQKRVTNAYIVYAANGNMTLKVTTAENGKRQTNTYTLVPPAVSDGPDVNRIGIGKGIRSRYWQFELVGEDVNCDIDEIGMLPVVLSRRI